MDDAGVGRFFPDAAPASAPGSPGAFGSTGGGGGGLGLVSGGASSAEAQLATVQKAIQTYVAAKDQDSLSLAEAEAEIRVLRDRIVHLQASKRGLNAIPENAAAIARHKELMERRLVKAREHQMSVLANNAKLRERVNELRREKATIVVLCAALREDASRLSRDSADTEHRTAALQAKCEEVDAQADGMHEECKMEVSTLEAENKRLLEEEKAVEARAAHLEMIAAQLLVGEAPTDPSHAAPTAAATPLRASAAPRARRTSKDAAALRAAALPVGYNPSERPLSRQIQSMIAAGKQPTLAELRNTARGLDKLKGSRSTTALPPISDEYPEGLPSLPQPTGMAATLFTARGMGAPPTLARAGSFRGEGGGGATARVLSQARWHLSFLEARRTTSSLAMEHVKEAFERAISAVGATSLDDFCARYGDAQREAENLYKRVAETTREADSMRTQLVAEWAAKAADGERAEVEDAERRALIGAVDARLQHSVDRSARLREENKRLATLTETCRRGLTRLQEILSGETSVIDESGGGMDGGTGGDEGATARLMEGAGGSTPAVSADASGAEDPSSAIVVTTTHQDIVSLYTTVETLLATTIAMYANHLHGVRIPVSLPSAAIAHAVSAATAAGSMPSGSASMQRLLAASPLAASPRDVRRDAAGNSRQSSRGRSHGDLRKAARELGAHPAAEEIPAVRGGIMTVTPAERRASLEMSLIDMRKGLLADAARSPTGAAAKAVAVRSKISGSVASSSGGGLSARSGSRGDGTGSVSSRGRGRMPSAHNLQRAEHSVSGTDADASPARSTARSSTPHHSSGSHAGGAAALTVSRPDSRAQPLAPIMTSPTAGRRDSRQLEGVHLPEVLLTPAAARGGLRPGTGLLSIDSAGGSAGPILDASVLRVGPDSPSRSLTNSPDNGLQRRHRSSVTAAPGIQVMGHGAYHIVPPSVEGPAASQILQHARVASRGGKMVPMSNAAMALTTARSASSLLNMGSAAMSGRSLLPTAAAAGGHHHAAGRSGSEL